MDNFYRKSNDNDIYPMSRLSYEDAPSERQLAKEKAKKLAKKILEQEEKLERRRKRLAKKRKNLVFKGENPIKRIAGEDDESYTARLKIFNCDDIDGVARVKKRRLIDTNGLTPQWNHTGFRMMVYGMTGHGKSNNILSLIFSAAIVATRIIIWASASALKTQDKYSEMEKYFKRTKYNPELIITDDPKKVPYVGDNPVQTLLIIDDILLEEIKDLHILQYATQGRSPGCSLIYITQNTVNTTNAKEGNAKKAFYGNATHIVIHNSTQYKPLIKHIFSTVSSVPGITANQFIEIFDRCIVRNISTRPHAFMVLDLLARDPPIDVYTKERRFLEAIFGFSFNPMAIRVGWDNGDWPFGSLTKIVSNFRKRMKLEEIEEKNDRETTDVINKYKNDNSECPQSSKLLALILEGQK